MSTFLERLYGNRLPIAAGDKSRSARFAEALTHTGGAKRYREEMGAELMDDNGQDDDAVTEADDDQAGDDDECQAALQAAYAAATKAGDTDLADQLHKLLKSRTSTAQESRRHQRRRRGRSLQESRSSRFAGWLRESNGRWECDVTGDSREDVTALLRTRAGGRKAVVLPVGQQPR